MKSVSFNRIFFESICFSCWKASHKDLLCMHSSVENIKMPSMNKVIFASSRLRQLLLKKCPRLKIWEKINKNSGQTWRLAQSQGGNCDDDSLSSDDDKDYEKSNDDFDAADHDIDQSQLTHQVDMSWKAKHLFTIMICYLFVTCL